MAKLKPDKTIAENFGRYRAFIDSAKSLLQPYIISKYKPNHPSSLYASYPVDSAIDYGSPQLITEIRESNQSDFSTSLISGAIESRVALRYDSGIGTHRNNIPTIPLKEQLVDTPHFHHFTPEGYFIAYQTSELCDPDFRNQALDITIGFPYFCKTANIAAADGGEARAIVSPEQTLDFPINNADPNEGVDFKTYETDY